MDWRKKRKELINKLPTLLDVLEHLAYGEERWALEKSPLRMAFPNHCQEGCFELVVMPDGVARLFPCSLSVNDYYRGQTAYYPDCRPSLLRKGMTESQVFVERLKLAEFSVLIQNHPLVKMYPNGFLWKDPVGNVHPVNLCVDAEALAQHYGIKTDLMDFTVDKWVAAFFACTDYDARTDTYSAHKSNGEDYGVFYMYVDLNFSPDGNLRLRPVGQQPFPRPGEQAGYVLSMYPGDNLNKKVAQKIKFRHVDEISELVFNYTNRSNKLFPYDSLQVKAKIIKESTCFSLAAFEKAKSKFYPDVDENVLQDYLKVENITLVSEPIVEYLTDEIDSFNEEWKSLREKEFLSKIIVRYTYNGPIIENSDK